MKAAGCKNSVEPVRIGIVGVGKIARDQHIPTLRASNAYRLVACASRHASVDGVESFPTIEAMIAGCPELDAVAICSPPQVHFAAARHALLQGKHVFLEKPPCPTTVQLGLLAELAARQKRTLYQTWHSQFAAGVEPAREWLATRKIAKVRVTWKEDVRKWHPGQTWIWQAGGFGVFDPGINALSILTRILPEPFFLTSALLHVPSNCQAPIAADLVLETASGARIDATFDFRQTGPQTWDVEIETDDGILKLSMGGSEIFIDGEPARTGQDKSEYAGLYRVFADLIRRGVSDVDGTPLQLVADAFLLGDRRSVEAFHD